ncbi:MAG TPA: GT4 family glycosyltransferase PelF, partial [Catenuloplanes sp.]
VPGDPVPPTVTPTTGPAEDVDVAIVMESTYPYLRGGVSAVVHDIIQGNPERTFGIIHITWDRDSPHTPVYAVPSNVKWIRLVYLTMTEHTDQLYQSARDGLRTGPAGRRALAAEVFDALDAVRAGRMAPLWKLYDETINPLTRTRTLWPLLGTKEFMLAATTRLRGAGLPFARLFWLLREFFSLACAVADDVFPAAAVYHSHTTGLAGLLAAVAARQNDGRVLLTEHNLYTRDAINTRLNRSMARPVRATDWATDTEVTPEERGWMAWFIELGRIVYDAADQITYLYPEAVPEAQALGASPAKACIVPNGMHVTSFDRPYQRLIERRAALASRRDTPPWRLAYCARLVPIKGLSDLLTSVATLVARGNVRFTLDVLGHADEAPEYAQACYDKCRELGLERHVRFVGSQDMREVLGEYDLLVLPSHNEGQPMVVLEFMAVGLPVVGTRVGGMQQLVVDPLVGDGGLIGPAGLLVAPHDTDAMAEAVERVLGDPERYAQFARNARARVTNVFPLDRATRRYGDIYADLALGSRV